MFFHKAHIHMASLQYVFSHVLSNLLLKNSFGSIDTGIYVVPSCSGSWLVNLKEYREITYLVFAPDNNPIRSLEISNCR